MAVAYPVHRCQVVAPVHANRAVAAVVARDDMLQQILAEVTRHVEDTSVLIAELAAPRVHVASRGIDLVDVEAGSWAVEKPVNGTVRRIPPRMERC